jgi:hypothetical protein
MCPADRFTTQVTEEVQDPGSTIRRLRIKTDEGITQRTDAKIVVLIVPLYTVEECCHINELGPRLHEPELDQIRLFYLHTFHYALKVAHLGTNFQEIIKSSQTATPRCCHHQPAINPLAAGDHNASHVQ